MELGIKGKKALVTGGSRGIGRAISFALAREGVRVAVIARTRADLEKVMTEIKGVESRHIAIPADLTSEGTPERIVEEATKKFGSLDIVVHNVGGSLGIRNGLSSIEDWQRVWRLNVEIAIEMNNRLIPAMKSQKWGRVVHISSISAVNAHGAVPYAASKAALNAYVRGMGRQVAADGVVVSAVMPGSVLAPGGHWDKTMKKDPEYINKYLNEKIATKRFGSPNEIADLAVFLCSERASFFAGNLIPIDGGTY